MPVTLGIPRETFPGERRVALTPRACEALQKKWNDRPRRGECRSRSWFSGQAVTSIEESTMATRAEVFASRGHHCSGPNARRKSGGGPRRFAAFAQPARL